MQISPELANNQDSGTFKLIPAHPIQRKKTKREAAAQKLLKKKLQESVRIEREFQREFQKQKENSKKRGVKPIFVRKISHKPTYCTVGSYILNKEDMPGYESSMPPAFTVKNDLQSSKSLCRLKNAVNWMLLFADKKEVKKKIDPTKPMKNGNCTKWWFRLAFLTLTVPYPQVHTDDYAKEHMLQPYLYWLQRYYNCSYVWKAESQINGDIHFHITIDQFVPWKAVRAKWNKILAKHGYCKVFQDGSNDRGDSATQIKAVINETKCAKEIANYVAKKDKLPTVVARGFEAIWKGELTCTKEITAAYKYLRWGKAGTTDEMLKVVKEAAETSQLHCDYNPEKPKPQPELLKRVIEGRLWGCSSELSNIKIEIEEGNEYIKGVDIIDHEGKIFFRQNRDIYNLGKTLIKRKKKEESKKSDPERTLLCTTDEDIERKYEIFKNVWIHPHLSLMKKGGHLQKLLHEQKLKGKFNKQKYFTEN